MPQIDFSKYAAPQSGQAIDFSKYAAAPTAAESTQPSVRQRLDSFLNASPDEPMGSRIGKAVGRLAVGIPETAWDIAKPAQTPDEVPWTAMGPLPLMVKRALSGNVAMGKRALNAVHEGDYPEAGRSALATALPVIGPWAAGVGERIGSGDVAGGLTEAAGALVGPELLRRGAPMLERAGVGTMNRALGVKGKNVRFGANPGEAVLNEVPGIHTREGLDQGIKERIPELGQQVSDIAQRADSSPGLAVRQKGITRTGGINLRPAIATPFDEALSNRLNPVTGIERPAFVDALSDERARLLDRPAEHMAPSEALAFRRNLKDDVNFNSTNIEPAGRSLIPAQRAAYGGVTRAFHDAVPEAVPIDERLHGLMAAREALAPQINRAPVSESWLPSLRDLPAEELGRAAAGAPGALFGMAANKAIRTTPFRTGMATALYRGGQLGADAPFAAWLFRKKADQTDSSQQ